MKRVSIDGIGGGTRRQTALRPAIRPKPQVSRPQAIGGSSLRRPMLDGLGGSVGGRLRAPVPGPQMALAGAAAVEPMKFEVQPWPQTPRRSLSGRTVGTVLATLAVVTGLTIAGGRYMSSVGQKTVAAETHTQAAQAAVSKPAAPQPAPPVDTITPLLTAFADTHSVPTGIQVINLKTGLTSSVNPDQVFISASLYKLFVAVTVYEGIDSGKISSSSRVGNTGSSVDGCLKYMITISDNACGEALGSLVGWESQNAHLSTLGFSHTQLRRGDSEQTSASDVALLLKRLHDGTLLSPNSTAAFTDLLKAQKVNNRLPIGLPKGTVIAHKTGDLSGLVHDAGIVYGPSGDYIIAVLTGPWSNVNKAPTAFGQLSGQVYGAITAAQ